MFVDGEILLGNLVKVVNDADFEKNVIENTKPTLVDFWAPGCGPCDMISPLIEKLAEEFSGEVEFFKMNIHENSEIPAGLGIRSIPYLVTFKGGDLLETIVGAPDPQKLVAMVERTLDES